MIGFYAIALQRGYVRDTKVNFEIKQDVREAVEDGLVRVIEDHPDYVTCVLTESGQEYARHLLDVARFDEPKRSP